VFQPFERGNTPNVRAIPGTGLGLTITKLLTQIMGGELLARSVVSSKEDRGTTFTVRLALTEVRDAKQAVTQRRIRGYAGERRKILLVDDDPAHVDIVREVLAPLDFAISSAQDGRSGIAVALESKPDLVLLDLSLPDMTGWDVARELRSHSSLDDLKIVVVSANAHEFNPGGDEQTTHDAFVMKPVDIQILLDCVASTLRVEWMYETPIPEASERALAAVPTQSRQHIDDLYQLGRIGHVRGIQSKLNELESADPANKPFATHLRKLIANFDLKGYMQTLEAMRSHA
jgi:CheY-like chemotaxis protein